MSIMSRRILPAALGAMLLALAVSPADAASPLAVVRMDYAYYNPVSLVLKEQGLIEQEFAKDGIRVEWVLSLGSNKALEFLSGNSVDFGSSAGAAALLARANGNPVHSIYVYSKPEWTALVTLRDAPIHDVADLRGKRVAVTKGTDPYIFLVRALASHGLKVQDVKTVLLQHPDGKVALERGDVDAWAGLDPYMAQTELEKDSRLFYRNADFNTYGVLNVREDFATSHPDIVERVLAVYEKARVWSLAHPDALKSILVRAEKQNDAVVAKQLERNDLTSGLIGARQRDAILAAGEVLKESGAMPADTDVAKVADALIDPHFIDRVAARPQAER